jgi:hypothetical protein
VSKFIGSYQKGRGGRLTDIRELKFWSQFELAEMPKNARGLSFRSHPKTSIGVKVEVLTYYGKGKLACVRCGFDDIRALSLDHINGRAPGEEWHNKNRSGQHLYRFLMNNVYPDGYQTLCMNCQWIKREENGELPWSGGDRKID